jgi:hypothetical protein
MSKSELEKFYNSQEGKEAGLSASEAKSEGIDSGRESARWIVKMKDTPVSEWTPDMWRWAKKQISFISRMSGNKGGLYDNKGKKTRKHTSLLIWGHNPEKRLEKGGEISTFTAPIFRKASSKYNIFEVVTENTNQVSRIFVRIAQHYDHKDFKNKIFTLDEFKKAYSGDGEFTYYDDWYGYNIPDYSMKSFLDGSFAPLSVEEQWLIDQIKSNVDLTKPYYIVGYSKNDVNATNHELSHALYYLSFTYKQKTNAVVSKIPQSELAPLNRFLAARNYDDSVLKDEMIAYLMADKEFLKKGNGWSDSYEPYHKELVSIFGDFNREIKKMKEGGNINNNLPNAISGSKNRTYASPLISSKNAINI